jgi:WD40 repeat protein
MRYRRGRVSLAPDRLAMTVRALRALFITTAMLPMLVDAASAVELRTIGRFGFAGAHSMVYSPRANLIAVGTAGGTQITDAKTGRPVVMFRPPAMFSAPVGRVAFSPDERTIVASGSPFTDWLDVWDVESGQVTGRIEGGGHSLAFSPDGTLVAGVASAFDENGDFVSRSEDIALWSLATRRKIAVLGSGRRVQTLAYSPDGSTLATGDGDNFVRLWDITSRREIATLTGHTDAVVIVAFSPDGGTLASGSEAGITRLWDVGGGQELATLAGHTDDVSALAFSTDGATLATGSYDQTVRLWNVASGLETAVLTGHESRILMVAFAPDGSSVISGSHLLGPRDVGPSGDAIRVWDLASRQVADSFGPPAFGVGKLAFSADGQMLATSGGPTGAEVALWDVASGRRTDILTAGDGYLYDVAFSPDGTVLAAGGADGVTVWDVASGQVLASLDGRHPTFTPDGAVLAIAGAEAITLWDFPSLQRVATLVGHGGSTFALAFSPDGTILAAGGRDRDRHPRHAVWLWDVDVMINAAREIGWDVPLLPDIARWPGGDDSILDLKFSPDGQLLAAGDRAQATRLWDVATRRQVASLSAPDRSRAIAFSPDGRVLASTGNCANGTLWDVASREEIANPVCMFQSMISPSKSSGDRCCC